jgi:biotin carboxyl carrier protein
VELEGKRFEVKFQERPDPFSARTKPKPPELRRSTGHSGQGDVLTAPMQGTIVKLLRQVGDKVKAGDPIMVLEAMKMENMITCHIEGVVKEIKVKAGQTVSVGSELALVEAE